MGVQETHPLSGCPRCDGNLECTDDGPYTYECEDCGLEMETDRALTDPRPN